MAGQRSSITIIILILILSSLLLAGTTSAQSIDLALEPSVNTAVVGDHVPVDIVAYGVDAEQGLEYFAIYIEFDGSSNYTNYTLPRGTEEEFVDVEGPGDVINTWEVMFSDVKFTDKTWSEENITLARFYIQGIREGETQVKFLRVDEPSIPEVRYNHPADLTYEIGELRNASIDFRQREYVDYRAEINRQRSRLNVSEEDNVSVSVNVTNIGTIAGSQDIELEIDDVFNDTYEGLRLLRGGDTQTIDFNEWRTTEGDAGNYTLEVRTLNHTITNSLQVFRDPDPGYFEVSIDEEASTLDIQEGEEATIVANISNTGDLDTSQIITLGVDGVSDDVDSRELNVSGGASESIELMWQDTEGHTGELSLNVSSENESATLSIRVEASGSLLESITELVSDSIVYIAIAVIVLGVGILSVFLVRSSSINLDAFRGGDGSGGEVGGSTGGGSVQEFDMSNDVFRSWTELIGYLDIENPKAKTPEEVEKIAIQHGLDRGKVRDLVSVYEEVLYSDATVTREQEERARRAIESLKVDLRDK